MKILFTPLAKSVLAPLGLTAAASATDAAFQMKIYGSRITLVFSNEEIHYIIKTFQSVKDAGLLIKDVTEAVKMN